MRAYAHDHFRFPLPFPLPEGHRFPLGKYRLVREEAEQLPGIEVLEAPATGWDELAGVHDPAYLRDVRYGMLDRRAQAALGLPWSPELVLRARRSAGATVTAAGAALEDGVAANLGGGTHHAGRAFGRGYCLFNDVVLAIVALRLEGRLRRVLVVDLDVHQGDGTADLLRGDDEAFLLSVQGAGNFPFKRIAADLDVDLPDGTGDDAYLAAVAPALDRALDRSRPELVVYAAGADPWESDRLGRLALSAEGLARRDALVTERCRQAGLPMLVVLAGGYGEPIEGTIGIHRRTLVEAAALAPRPAAA